jgi:hypothetical protein
MDSQNLRRLFWTTWLNPYLRYVLNIQSERVTSAACEKSSGAVARLVGNEGGVVSGVFNLESSGVEAPDWRPRHDEHYHEA